VSFQLKTAKMTAFHRARGCAAPLMAISGTPVASADREKVRFPSSNFRSQFEGAFVPANVMILA